MKTPFTVEVINLDKPSLRGNEVLIKVKATGICGSDVHAYRGTHPFRKPPVILGHEIAGEVEEVGKKVKNIQLGDPITVEPQTHCGSCPYCFEGKYNLCLQKKVMGTSEWRGSFAEYVVAPEDILYKLPEEVTYEKGALVEPLAVGVHTVKEAKLRLGESVVIFGAGTIGLVVLACLHVAGATKVVVTDIQEFNLKLASQLGATQTVNVNKLSPKKAVDKLTGGRGVDVAIIAAAVEGLVKEATQVVKKTGRIIVPAIFDEYAKVDMFPIVYGEQHLQGSWAYTKKDFTIAIDLLALGKVNLNSLITHRIPLDNAQKAFEVLDKRSEKVVKILFNF